MPSGLQKHHERLSMQKLIFQHTDCQSIHNLIIDASKVHLDEDDGLIDGRHYKQCLKIEINIKLFRVMKLRHTADWIAAHDGEKVRS